MNPRRLRLGMIGGGQGAFIGAIHRMAARLDDRYDLVAGVFARDARASAEFGRGIGLDPTRVYEDVGGFVAGERERPDGVEVACVVTPNDSHHAIAVALLSGGFHVLCEKPLAISVEQANELANLAVRSRRALFVAYVYSGYAMVRKARALVASGALGRLRVLRVEYAQGWLAASLEHAPDEEGHRQAAWRADPSVAGPAGCLGDIGTHAFHLAEFVSGCRVRAVSARLSRHGVGRRLDDDVDLKLEFEDGLQGGLWASQVAIGSANGLRLRLFGEDGGLEWSQDRPELLAFTPRGRPTVLLNRGGPDVDGARPVAGRLPEGHPEGFIEAFGQLYSDIADLIVAYGDTVASGTAALLPQAIDGARGLRFVMASIASDRDRGAWTRLDAS